MNKSNNDFIESISELKDLGYYWGPIKFNYAEEILKRKENGSFLLRDSQHENYLLTISFKSDDYIFHVRVEHMGNGKFNFQKNFDTFVESKPIVQFIETIIEKSKSNNLFYIRPRANASSLFVKFLYPISRFKEQPVSSLQHLTRFTILKYIRKDKIDFLNLPNKLKQYLKQNQIFIENKR
jgi:suppressor of cytokine signaling 6/7